MTCRLQQGVQLYPGMYDMNVYAMFDVCSKVLDAMFGMCSKVLDAMFGMCSKVLDAMFGMCSKVLDAMFGMCSKGWIQCLECAANVRLEEHMLC